MASAPSTSEAAGSGSGSASKKAPLLDERSTLVKPAEKSFNLWRDFSAYPLGLQPLFVTKLNLLLFAGIVPLVAAFVPGIDEAIVFLFALLTLMPLAERLGFLTEQIAFSTSQTVAGLLNATLGNVPELIVAVVAVTNNNPAVAQQALMGSVVSDLLLVLGLSFLVGGLRRQVMRFNTLLATALASVLLLAAIAFMFPKILQYMSPTPEQEVINRALAFLMLATYLIFLYFQLGTHSDSFEDEGDDDEEDEECVMGPLSALLWMGAICVAIAYYSDFVVDTIEHAALASGIPSLFLASIVLPNVNNAPEHAVAILLAYKGKMDIVIGIAVGAAVQNAALILPIAQIYAWPAGVYMTMDKSLLESVAILIAVVVYAFMASSGTATWVHGMVLLVVYLIIAVVFLEAKIGPEAWWDEWRLMTNQSGTGNTTLAEFCLEHPESTARACMT